MIHPQTKSDNPVYRDNPLNINKSSPIVTLTLKINIVPDFNKVQVWSKSNEGCWF